MNSTSTDVMTPERADYQARCFVNGMRRHGKSGKMEPAAGEFSARFINHPWVRESVTEGWGKSLRSHLIMTVRRRIMRGESYDVIEMLMPPKEWIVNEKQLAAQSRSASEWQKENLPQGVGLHALLNKIRKQSGLDA